MLCSTSASQKQWGEEQQSSLLHGYFVDRKKEKNRGVADGVEVRTGVQEEQHRATIGEHGGLEGTGSEQGQGELGCEVR